MGQEWAASTPFRFLYRSQCRTRQAHHRRPAGRVQGLRALQRSEGPGAHSRSAKPEVLYASKLVWDEVEDHKKARTLSSTGCVWPCGASTRLFAPPRAIRGRSRSSTSASARCASRTMARTGSFSSTSKAGIAVRWRTNGSAAREAARGGRSCFRRTKAVSVAAASAPSDSPAWTRTSAVRNSFSCARSDSPASVLLQTAPMLVCSFNVWSDAPRNARWAVRREDIADSFSMLRPICWGFRSRPGRCSRICRSGCRTTAGWAPGAQTAREPASLIPSFYRRDRFKLSESGTFWLARKPPRPARGWGCRVPPHRDLGALRGCTQPEGRHRAFQYALRSFRPARAPRKRGAFTWQIAADCRPRSGRGHRAISIAAKLPPPTRF